MHASATARRSGLIRRVLKHHAFESVGSFIEHFETSNGDLEAAMRSWDHGQGPSLISSDAKADIAADLKLTTELAAVSGDNQVFVEAALEQTPANRRSLRQFAINSSLKDIAAMISPSPSSVGISSLALGPDTFKAATEIRRKLFLAEPTGVVMRMLKDEEIVLGSNTESHVYNLLDEQPDFDLRKASASSLLAKSQLFKTMPAETQATVESGIKTLQRVQSLSPVPETIHPLIAGNLTSALLVSNMAETAFVQQLQPHVGDAGVATSIHRHAVHSRIRNENFLISSMQTVHGSGLRVIDGGNSKDTFELRKASFNAVCEQTVTQVNLEHLFGSLDSCECSDCGSVYSPAAYFVELMEFLRNNNMSADHPKTGAKDIEGTQLEALLRRRPDLACLQLTCENTKTLIPYIDLALEVMESYVVHAPMITAYNVDGEKSSELLCSPQHTNLTAYEILRSEVYPLALPYHLPIDTMRVFLQFLKTTRADILRVFGPPASSSLGSPPSAPTTAVLRDYDAEYHLINQEEYIIMTKEPFHPPIHFRGPGNSAEYAEMIGLQSPWKYFGYNSRREMLDDDSNTMRGLSWVKTQFMKRTGVEYNDLVDLLKTRYINPNIPTGAALATMERIRFSYRFLQDLVYQQHRDKQRRFARLIQFLEHAGHILPWVDMIRKSPEIYWCADPNSVGGSCDPPRCPPPHQWCCCDKDQWPAWVYNWFEKIGCIIVLESGEGPRIPLKGRLWAEARRESLAVSTSPDPRVLSVAPRSDQIFVGTLQDDGVLLDRNQNAVGLASATGVLINLRGNKLQDDFLGYNLNVYAVDSDVGQFSKLLGYVGGEPGLLYYKLPITQRFRPIEWRPAHDDCDITKTRLMHLDGTQLSPEEYFRIVRFLRLWNKLGWAMGDVDEAIIGLSRSQGSNPTEPPPSECSADDDDDDDDDDQESPIDGADINPVLIHQLVSVKKMLDLTGLPVQVILAFWGDIPTHGTKSLYSKLFLAHNIVRMDPVFEADAEGYYLTAHNRISDHLPVLQTVLRLGALDIATIRQLRGVPDWLTLRTLSELYRFSTLIRFLSIRASLLPDVLAVLGEPFKDADTALSFVRAWQQITNSNFSFQQLNYLIRGVDNVTRPLGPTPQSLLKIAKTLLDGLDLVSGQNPDITQEDVDNKTVSLSDLLPAKLALVFDPVLATRINDLIQGRMVFTTNAPLGLEITIPASSPLFAKVKYAEQVITTTPTAQLTVTGVLTGEEFGLVKALSNHALWGPTVDRIKKQGHTFYNQYLASILPDDGAATLLAGDTPDKPTTKGVYFLKYFMPFLRARLATEVVQQTISNTMGTNPTTAAYFLNIVKASSGDSALTVLLGLKDGDQFRDNAWQGFLIPTSTDVFQFSTISDIMPAPLLVNGLLHVFHHQSEDPSNIWSTNGISLVAGTFYNIHLSSIRPQALSWTTSTSPPTTIPSNCLLPAVSSFIVSEVFLGLTKMSMVLQGFNLSLDEIAYFHENGPDFASLADNTPLDVGNLTLGTWQRLHSYVTLRDSLPKQETSLIDLFAWSKLLDANDVVAEIVKVTIWDAALTTEILAGYRALTADKFHNEILLTKVQEALAVVKKTEISVPLLFEWAKPVGLSCRAYYKLSEHADTLKMTLRSRYNATDWEQTAKPLFDTLRRNQRDALVAYLVVEKSLVETGLDMDANGLFEYFLIDSQMSSCLETTRIQQAISTIQLYVQRCLLGLEAEVGASEDVLIDRERWNWMKRYRVWEANQRVYLYPENWIMPSLRDDKTLFFLDLESSLQQKDITLASATKSLKSYIYNVASVANMKVFGLFVHQSDRTEKALGAHMVARRMNVPYDWYSRDYAPDGTWSPWVKMDVDIPNYDVDDVHGQPVDSGSYVTPYLWQGRPILFFLQLVLKRTTIDNAQPLSSRFNQDGKFQEQSRPLWQINLGVSRFDNGKWSPKELSQSSLRHLAPQIDITENGVTMVTYPVPNQARYKMVPRLAAGTSGAPDHILLDVLYTEDQVDVFGGTKHFNESVGSFVFIDGAIAQQIKPGRSASDFDHVTSFQYLTSSGTIYSYQALGSASPSYFKENPSVTYPSDATSGTKSKFTVSAATNFVFNHTFVDPLLKQISATDNLAVIYDDFAALSQGAETAGDNPFGRITQADGSPSYNELMSPYGVYNAEIGLHGPMTLIESLLNAQQFDDALTVCHTILDPCVVGSSASSSGDNSQFWKYLPFKALANTDAKESLEQIFLKLAPRTSDADISAWRDKPFSPHLVARMRPVAYMKWIAMKYIQILIAYGDYYFRQNSLETIPDAIQCYLLARHVCGTPGKKIPQRGKKKPETYISLLNRWDAFGNAIVQLEVEFPFSNQTSRIIGSSKGITGFANIYGFSSSPYFCIPHNPQITQLSKTIDDRLSNIRNCMHGGL